MRENAPPARPTLADRQVPASSSTEHGHLSSFFESAGGDATGSDAVPVASLASGDVVPVPAEVAKTAFEVFKIAGNGELVLLDGTATLDAAVERVVGLRAYFPGEYIIVSQTTGRKILFTKQGAARHN
jgi:hypothetical protein